MGRLVIKSNSYLRSDEMFSTLLSLLKAACVLQQFNIVHCDIRADNCLVKRDSGGALTVALNDMGVAAWVNGTAVNKKHPAAHDTRHYFLPPEAFQSSNSPIGICLIS